MSKNEIEPSEVARRVHGGDGDDLYVLDVRNRDDYEEWQIDGSHNLPIYDELLDGDLSTLQEHVDALPRDEEIAVVCVGGVTSADAADLLSEEGFEARSMADGMKGWGQVHRAYDVPGANGVVQVVRPGTGCISYLVHDGESAIVADPSMYVDEYLNVADDLGVDVVGAVDTHAHADHVSGGRHLADELDVPYYLHGADAGELDRVTPVSDGDVIPVGEREVTVRHTPGHTPGSISLLVDDALLSGDTLFIRSVGRPDLEGNADAEIREAASQLFESLDDLTDLDGDHVVLPGHFSDESIRPLATDLGELREDNELLGLVEADDESGFVETIVEGLSTEPANYNRIKAINWGEEPADGDAEELELGPNNCAAN